MHRVLKQVCSNGLSVVKMDSGIIVVHVKDGPRYFASTRHVQTAKRNIHVRVFPFVERRRYIKSSQKIILHKL
jgi:hypothetical protein